MSETADQSRHWEHLKVLVTSASMARTGCLLMMPILSIFECVAVNFVTGGPAPLSYWAFGFLVLVALLHIILTVALIKSDAVPSGTSFLESLRIEQELEHAKADAKRQADGYRMIRSAFDALNLQTCSSMGHQIENFRSGLSPIMERLTCGLKSTLGITSAEFTIEVYFSEVALDAYKDGYDGFVLAHMMSTRKIDEWRIHMLGERSPLRWGWQRQMPGQCAVEDDKERFYVNGSPDKNLYFSRFATVPIHFVCDEDQAGILIVTSAQEEPFADGILEVMGFVASLLSHYLSAFNRCQREHDDELRRKEKSRKRREKKEAVRNAVQADSSESSMSPFEEYPTLTAEYLSGTHSSGMTQVELRLNSEVWSAGELAVTTTSVTVQGKVYPITWTEPPDIEIQHEDSKIIITA